MELKNQTILITGGTSGIGKELAKQLLDAGNTVIITGRDELRLERARMDLKGVHVFESDVSDSDAVEKLRERVTQAFPGLNILVNNAGVMRNLNLNSAESPIDISREIATNLMGPVVMTQQFLPHLTRQRAAAVVNVSSGLALIPYSLSPIYSAAKAGLHAYTRCLRTQMAGTSVKVIELLPPPTETPLFRGEFEKEMQGQKGMPASELVRQAIAGIEAGKEDIRPGLAKVLGVMSRVAPKFMMAQMTKMSVPKT